MMQTLRNGSSGDDVATWQRIVGVTPDGAFGPQTEAATRAWQSSHGLTADGVVGPKTWAAAGVANTVPAPSKSGVAMPAFPGFAKLSRSDQQSFIKAAQWIAPGEPDAPKWLAAIVEFESGWDPSRQNPGPSKATGLIQFINPTARALGTTTDALRRMSFSAQLEYVKRYFSEIAGTRGKIHSLADMYLSVFSPKGVGGSPSMVLYSAGQPGYDQNAGLDHDGKGFITVGDVVRAPLSRLNSVANLAPILVPMGIGFGTLLFLGGIGYLSYRYMKGGA